MPRYELVEEGTQRKFWEVELRGATVVVRWGKVGKRERVREFVCESVAAATAKLDEIVLQKLGKGYELAGEQGRIERAIHESTPPKAFRQLNEEQLRALLRGLGAPSACAATSKADPRGGEPISKHGGATWADPSEPWPTYAGEPLHHLLTVRVDELPSIPKALDGIALLTVFTNNAPSDGPHHPPTDNSDIVIRTYPSLDKLVRIASPIPAYDAERAITWVVVTDYPDLHAIQDTLFARGLDAPASEIEAARDLERLDHQHVTKIGGWPTPVRNAVPRKGFVLQLLEGPFGDAGICYFHRSESGWEAEWSAY